jgi:hypothetical protein
MPHSPLPPTANASTAAYWQQPRIAAPALHPLPHRPHIHAHPAHSSTAPATISHHTPAWLLAAAGVRLAWVACIVMWRPARRAVYECDRIAGDVNERQRVWIRRNSRTNETRCEKMKGWTKANGQRRGRMRIAIADVENSMRMWHIHQGGNGHRGGWRTSL